MALTFAVLGVGLMCMNFYVVAANYRSATFFCGQDNDYFKVQMLVLGVSLTALASAAALQGWRPKVKLPAQLIACWLTVAVAAFWTVPLIPDCPIFD